MRKLYVTFTLLLFGIGFSPAVWAQDTLLVTAPTVYPCVGGGFFSLGDIVIEERIGFDNQLPSSTVRDTLIFRISNTNRFQFDTSASAAMSFVDLAGPLTIDTGVNAPKIKVSPSGDSLMVDFRLFGATAGTIDRFAIRGVRVSAKGTQTGVAEIIRIGGSTAWPGIRVNQNVVFGTLIGISSSSLSVNAGTNQTKCFPEPFTLSGSVTAPFVDSVVWTTNRNGTFSNSNSRNTTYTPGSADSTNGNATLTLTLVNNTCATAVTSTVNLTVSPRVVVNAGTDATQCANGPFNLSGSISGAPSGVWSGGGGAFAPNSTTLTATYTPTANEVNDVNFSLVLTSTGGTCLPVRDTVVLTSNPKNRPSVFAGNDTSLCIGSVVNLAGTASNLSGATTVWTKASLTVGGAFGDTTALTTTYTPSIQDYDAGFVRLALNTVGGTCGIFRDTVVITFTPLPIASLVCSESDTAVCVGQPISFTAFGGQSFRFFINNTPQGSASATATFTSSSLANGDSIRAQVFSGATGSGCVSTSNRFRVRINPNPTAPTWNPGAQNYPANGSPVNLDSIGNPTPPGGTFSGTGVVGNFFFPNLLSAGSSSSITYTVSANGCTASSPPQSFSVFDQNQLISGLNLSYCLNSPSNTIIIRNLGSILLPNDSYDSIGFFSGGQFYSLPGAIITKNIGPFDPTDSLYVTFNPAFVGDQSRGSTGDKSVRLRVQRSGQIVDAVTQETRINPVPTVLITNKLPQFVCEGTQADTIKLTATLSGTPISGSISFTGSVTSLSGGLARYNTVNDNQTTYPVTRTATATFVTSNTGCTTSDSSVYTVLKLPQPPQVPVFDTLLCKGDLIPSFSASTDTSALPPSIVPELVWLNDLNSVSATSILAQSVSTYPQTSNTISQTDTIYVRQRSLPNCFSNPVSIFVRVTDPPIINPGQPDTVCQGDSIRLIGSVSGAPSGLTTTWRVITNNPGTIRDSTSLSTSYIPSNSDIFRGTQGGFVNLRLLTSDPDGPNRGCPPQISSIVRHTINRAATLFAGNDTVICSGTSTRISPRFSPPDLSGSWISGIQGTFEFGATVTSTQFFTPDTNSLSLTDSTRFSMIYQTADPDGAEPCTAISDTLFVRTNPRNILNAGNDTVYCEAVDTITPIDIRGNILGASFVGRPLTPVIWSANGGHSGFRNASNQPDSIFTPVGNTNAVTYLASQADVLRGFVWLSLTALDPDGTEPCTVVRDSVRIQINRRHRVFAGVDDSICSNSSITLTAQLFGNPFTAGRWIDTLGISSAINPLATFTPVTSQISDTAITFVDLIWQTNDVDGSGPCAVERDTVRLFIFPKADVSVSKTFDTLCAGSSIVLDGAVGGGASSATWVGGLGTFSPDRTTVNATYSPNSTEIPINFNRINVPLALVSEDPFGPCQRDTAFKRVTVNRIPLVNADTLGRDTIVVCAGDVIRLTGSFGGSATFANWEGGEGTFAPGRLLTTSGNSVIYALDSANANEYDSANRIHITFILRTQDFDGPNGCDAAVDTVVVRIDPAVIVDAGVDRNFCASDSIILIGAVGGSSSSAIWSGRDTASFSNHRALTTQYLPTLSELLPDTVITFYLSSDSLAGGSCPSKTDSVRIGIIANPVLTIAIADTQFCNLSTPIQGNLSATILNVPNLLGTAAMPFNTGISNQGVTFDSQTSPNSFIFNPFSAGNGLKEIRYEFTRNAGGISCFSDTTLNIVVHSQPRAALTWDGTCQGDSINFTDVTFLDTTGQFGNNTLVNWLWDFDLGSIATDTINGIASDSSILVQNPTYLYPTPGLKRPSLTVVTNNGCSNRVDSLFAIGSRTKPDFSWQFVCPGDSTEYSDSLSILTGSGNVKRWRWEFGSTVLEDSVSISLRKVKHQYPGPGAYLTKLILETEFKCIDTIAKTVNILASTNPFPNSPYIQDFNVTNGFWVAGGQNSDWGYGRLLDTLRVFNQGKDTSDRFWQTAFGDSIYKRSQNSFVNGPCVNVSNLDRPMLVLDYLTRTTQGGDGTVVQYSIDGGLNWILLGELNSGINWYNRRDLSGNPGRQLTGNFGWNGIDSIPTWRTARQSLDILKTFSDSIQRNIRFRMVFGSDATDPIVRSEGFAFDNVRIENRTRNVLLEFFNNASAPSAVANNNVFRNILSSTERDAAGVAYHLSSGSDPINARNPADPSARALFYGVSSPNEVVFNGRGIFPLAQTDSIGKTRIELQALLPPKINVEVLDLNINATNATVEVRLEALQRIEANTRLQLALVESSVNIFVATGPMTYSWVLRKMIPSASGTLFNRAWEVGDTARLTLTGDVSNGLIDNLQRVGIVAFVQNNQTREVEQATLYRLDTSGWNVVGISELLVEDVELSVFPNPANDRVNLTLSKAMNANLSILLMDGLGRTIQQAILPADAMQHELHVTDLRAGVYILKLIDTTGRTGVNYTTKLIIRH